MQRSHIDIDIDSIFEKYTLPDGSTNMDMINELATKMIDPERFLLKAKKYQEQQEYRIAWFVGHCEVDYIDILCPEAIKYCRRIEKNEY